MTIRNSSLGWLLRLPSSDPAKRVDMYAELETYMVKEVAIIAPIYWYSRNTVTKPYVVRTFGVGGQEAIEKWDVLPH